MSRFELSSNIKENPKPCITCKHYDGDARCRYDGDDNKKPDTRYGYMQKVYDASVARKYDEHCGEEGRWWEEKKGIFTRLRERFSK